MVQVRYFSASEKGVYEADSSLGMDEGLRYLDFSCSKFDFRIILEDFVDVEELSSLLSNKDKKIMLGCRLNNKYKGHKKFTWRGDYIAVSQGGARLEFGRECIDMISASLSALKARI